ncbi:MAG: ABC transporter substrate-binding protein [Firmicutes bacterium]|jgi:branched-chain amino acid transport system substrate-binding protein|nr:ABC transporter substrate-binding protein [Bacillota bacterium]
MVGVLKRQTVYVIIAVLVIAVGLGIGLSRRSGGKEIRIGGNFELTGGVASFGVSARNGIVLALEQANEQDVLDGYKIKLIEADNKSDNAETTNMATKLITKDNVVAMLGPVISSNSIAAANVAQEMQVPMLTPTATAPDVTKVGDYIFRACFMDDFQAIAMAEFAYNTLGSRKAAMLVNSGDPYSTALASFFRQRFEELGGQIVAEEKYLSKDTEFRPQLTKIKSSGADMIYIPGYYEEQGAIARQAREMGINVPLTGGDGWDSAKLVEIAGAENLNDIYFTNHYSAGDDDPVVQEFVKAYEARFGHVPDAFAALGYEAGWILVDALKRAESFTPKAIRDALAATENLKILRANITMGADRNPIKDGIIVELKNGVPSVRDVIQP